MRSAKLVAHNLQMPVAVRQRVNAEPKQLVLCVLRHNARVAHAVAIDPAPVLVRPVHGLHRLLQRRTGQGFAVGQQGRHGVVDYLEREFGHRVALIHAAVDVGHAIVQSARQLELEVDQALVAQAAAKAHHGRFAHPRLLGKCAHGQEREALRVLQHQFRHPALRR